MALRGICCQGVLLLGMALAGMGFSADKAPPREVRHVVILHTNDLHGQVMPLASIANPQVRELGGYDAIAGYVRAESERAARTGASVLLLDAGDIWQGTPEGSLTHGQVVVDLMNDLDFDAMTVGNHEFDHGLDRLVELRQRSHFPWLAANVKTTDGRTPDWVRPWVILDAGGLPVGVVGLISSLTPSMTTRTATEGLVFEPELEAAERAIAEVRAAGARLVILLSHCGVEMDRTLSALPGVAAIVGGHSHTALPTGETNGETGCIVCQAGAKGRFVGRLALDIDADTGVVISREACLVDMRRSRVPLDPGAREIIGRYAPGISAYMDVVVGEAQEPLLRNPAPSSSPLGNFLTDLMCRMSGADVAFQNKTGIRADLPAGPITRRHLFEVSPFGNTIATLTFTGAQLQAELEYSFGAPVRFLEMSGIEVAFDPDAPEGSRVQRVVVRGEPLDPARTYRVATNNFLALGGDGHFFLQGQDPQDTGMGLFEATVDAFTQGSPLAPDGTNRVVMLGADTPEPTELPATDHAPQPVGAGTGG